MGGIVADFFGPTWRSAVGRIIMGFFLFLVVTYIHSATWPWVDYWATGWPLHFHETWGPCFSETSVCSRDNPVALVLDIVIWYLVLCATLFFHDILRNKPEDAQ